MQIFFVGFNDEGADPAEKLGGNELLRDLLP
jgi:hypothetical protein